MALSQQPLLTSEAVASGMLTSGVRGGKKILLKGTRCKGTQPEPVFARPGEPGLVGHAQRC